MKSNLVVFRERGSCLSRRAFAGAVTMVFFCVALFYSEAKAGEGILVAGDVELPNLPLRGEWELSSEHDMSSTVSQNWRWNRADDGADSADSDHSPKNEPDYFLKAVFTSQDPPPSPEAVAMGFSRALSRSSYAGTVHCRTLEDGSEWVEFSMAAERGYKRVMAVNKGYVVLTLSTGAGGEDASPDKELWDSMTKALMQARAR